jgi:hypothetical protein
LQNSGPSLHGEPNLLHRASSDGSQARRDKAGRGATPHPLVGPLSALSTVIECPVHMGKSCCSFFPLLIGQPSPCHTLPRFFLILHNVPVGSWVEVDLFVSVRRGGKRGMLGTASYPNGGWQYIDVRGNSHSHVSHIVWVNMWPSAGTKYLLACILHRCPTAETWYIGRVLRKRCYDLNASSGIVRTTISRYSLSTMFSSQLGKQVTALSPGPISRQTRVQQAVFSVTYPEAEAWKPYSST